MRWGLSYELRLSASLLGTVLLMRGVFTLFSQPVIILHFMDLGFLCMGVFLVAGIVSKWLCVGREPWIVWQGEYKYGGLTRSLVPLFVAFILLVLVMVTGVVLLVPDIIDLNVQKGG
jgi:hypothetical protein